jgi:hypothetical protein
MQKPYSNDRRLPASQIRKCLFFSQPGHSILECRQATIWLRAPFRPRVIKTHKGDPRLPKHARATPPPALDSRSTPAPSSLPVPPSPIAAPSPAQQPTTSSPPTVPSTSSAAASTPPPLILPTTPAPAPRQLATSVSPPVATTPTPAPTSSPAPPITAPPPSEAIMLTPQPSSAALSPSFPASLESQPSAVATATLPVRATTLPPADSSLTAPPSPLATPSPHPCDIMRKAKPRQAQGTQQHSPFRTQHRSARLCAFTRPSWARHGFARSTTHRPNISSCTSRLVYDPGGNSIGSNGDSSDAPSPATLWPVEERGSRRISRRQPLTLI